MSRFLEAQRPQALMSFVTISPGSATDYRITLPQLQRVGDILRRRIRFQKSLTLTLCI